MILACAPPSPKTVCVALRHKSQFLQFFACLANGAMDFEEFSKGHNSGCLFVDLKGHILPENHAF